MRRKERQLSGTELSTVLEKAVVCRIALSENDIPYIVPVCFGYRDGCLYFHCAPEGKKLDILRRNNRVCFEMDIDCEPVQASRPCNWGMRYRSVIGYGRGFIVEGVAEKTTALDLIMEHYGGAKGDYPDDITGKTTVVKIVVESMTGKQGRSS